MRQVGWTFRHLLRYCCTIRTRIWIYIHNWPLQSFSQVNDLVSHTTYVVCVNFIHKWRDLQFKVDSERQIFWETLPWRQFFLSESCWEETVEEILFVFCFWCLTWNTNPGFTSTSMQDQLNTIRAETQKIILLHGNA